MQISPAELARADGYTLQDLTDAYNQARVDYLIPMPMTVDYLAAYQRLYDLDLGHSWVLRGQGTSAGLAGLALLGARAGRTWVTRLGVGPHARRGGAGERLLRALLEETRALGCEKAMLEVIEGNGAAQRLFERVGFGYVRGLRLMRRAAGPPVHAPSAHSQSFVRWAGAAQALDLLAQSPHALPWTNQPETYSNAGDGQAVLLDDPSVGQGWLVLRAQGAARAIAGEDLRADVHTLSHFVFATQAGEPGAVAGALLAALYTRWPGAVTDAENIPADDPHLPALLAAGCAEPFRRVEMVWLLP